jgi:glyoxylase-like metal-dependent hydrolase (beta-lactamase superfamily II)
MSGLTDRDAGTLTLGDVRVTALVDVLTSMSNIAEIFVSSALPWPTEELATRFPDEFENDTWRFIMRCFLLEVGDTNILVDAGAGPASTGMCQAMGIEGHLLDRLTELGVDVDDIDHVVFTHQHADHVGWSTVPGQGGHRPTFRRARYHLHPADFELGRDRRHTDPGRYWERVFAPLAASRQLDLDPSARSLAPGVALLNTPGHTPGHRVVEVSGAGGRMLIIGDLLHFSFQIADPSIASRFDMDAVAAATARAAVLKNAAGTVLASPHLAQAFTRLGANL